MALAIARTLWCHAGATEETTPAPMTLELGPPFEVLHPESGSVPLVLSSPHSGEIYPPSLLSEIQVQLGQLRSLEDRWVDRLFGCGTALGAPLLRARFARAFVDPNREAFELDAALFEGPLPAYVNARSAKALAGLGTIPSRVGGKAIYRARLEFAEAERRIRFAYWPYHRALQSLLAQARYEFGVVLLLDCHSMPSFGGTGSGADQNSVDFALGDRFGRSCAPAIVERVETMLQRRGFRVARNRPYAGGHITACYGRPETGIHALQIEIRRSLFMDERTREAHPGVANLERTLRDLLADLATFIGAHPGPLGAWPQRSSACDSLTGND